MDLPLPAERHRRIQEYLREHRAARVSMLAELLGVSEVTIRRDLEDLEGRGLLERTHGGAILAQRMAREPLYVEAASSHPVEKQRIGAAAARLATEGDIVFLNGGTTTLEVVRHLGPHVRVVTNHVGAALEAGDRGMDLILVGGEYRFPSNSCVGDLATRTLRGIFATRSFIGVEGLSLRAGFTTPAIPEAAIARVMIEQTHGQVVVVADSSKVGTVADFWIAPIEAAAIVVTDSGLDDEYRAELTGLGVQVVVADEPPLSPTSVRD
ncbi:MAG: DeoR/GlpR family DNA-binding transcription regulator [Actinomycetota bacterium]